MQKNTLQALTKMQIFRKPPLTFNLFLVSFSKVEMYFYCHIVFCDEWT